MNNHHDGEPGSHNEAAPGGMRLPSLMALRCFEVAARLENFTRAAEALHLTHGAVSRAVRALEEDLGLALFERRSRKVFLTPAGRKLAHAAEDGFGIIRAATDELRRQGQRQRYPRWVLSCEPTLLMRWLIPRWPAFQDAHGGMHVQFVAGGGPFSFDDGIDLAIRRDDFAWPADYHAQTLFAERIGPVCRPDKVEAFFERIDGAMALRRRAPRLHTRTRPQAWDHWRKLAGARAGARAGAGAGADANHEFDHFYFSLQAASAGIGVAMGPWQLVRDDLASGLLVAPLGFIEDGSCYCLLSRSREQAATIPQALVDWLQAQGG